MQKNNYIGYCGMSHLGLNYLATSAIKNFEVIGYDSDKKHIDNLKKNIFQIKEPGLENALRKNKKKIMFTSQIEELKKCKLIFISLDIKTDTKNNSDYKEIFKLIHEIMNKLSHKFSLVILSQVYPGFTSKLKKKNIKIFYQVETLIFGKALNCAINPSRIIIGSKSKNISGAYAQYLKKFQCEKIITNLETAEFTKIAINLYLISNLTLTNTLNNISNNIGARWKDVQHSLRLDKRIGKYSYLKPGMGIASGNLERDLMTILNISSLENHSKNLFSLWKKISLYHEDWIIRNLNDIKINFKDINLLGITYKPQTNSLKNSVAIKIIKRLKNIRFHCYDPEIKTTPKIKNLFLYQNMNTNFIKSKILIIATNHEIFKRKKFQKLIKLKNIKYVIDPFGILSIKNKNIKHYKI